MTKEDITQKIKRKFDCHLEFTVLDAIKEAIEWGQNNPENIIKTTTDRGLKSFLETSVELQLPLLIQPRDSAHIIALLKDKTKPEETERPKKIEHKLEPFDLEKAKVGEDIYDTLFKCRVVFIGVAYNGDIVIEGPPTNGIPSLCRQSKDNLRIKTEVKPIVHEFWVIVYEKGIVGIFTIKPDINYVETYNTNMGKFIEIKEFTVII